jgi:lambda family phage portal protein
MVLTINHDSPRWEMIRDIEKYVGGGVSSQYAMNGAYEGADRFDRSVALWSPPIQSADREMLPEKGLADARVRDLQRNDGYVQTGRQLHRDGIVGSQYTLNAKPNITVLGMDEVWAGEFQQEVEAKFTLAAESSHHWLDAAGVNTFTALIRLAVGVYAAGGEVLATAEWLRETGRPFQTAVQMVDADRLSSPWSHAYNTSGQRVRGGVHQDKRGKPLGYYIEKAHRSDWDRMGEAGQWTYVAARKKWGRRQVFHVLEQQRVDQSRGLSEMVAGLKQTRIAKRFREVTLQQAALAASYATSIESELPSEAVFAAMGGTNLGPGAAATAYAGEYLAAVQQYAAASKHMQLDGVKIPHFFPGTKLNVKQVGAPGGVGQEFETSILRHLSAILGVSYEELSHDYSKTNYSSARAGMNNTWKFMQSRKKMVADRFADFLYELWLEEQINTSSLDCMKSAKLPNFYDALMKEAYTSATWIGAPRGQIDEVKETQAAILRMSKGLSTAEEECARLGKDWREVYAQMERERKDREARGIVLEQSNAINAASGDPREAAEPNNADPEEE